MPAEVVNINFNIIYWYVAARSWALPPRTQLQSRQRGAAAATESQLTMAGRRHRQSEPLSLQGLESSRGQCTIVQVYNTWRATY